MSMVLLWLPVVVLGGRISAGDDGRMTGG
jgi:hypothetical protein